VPEREPDYEIVGDETGGVWRGWTGGRDLGFAMAGDVREGVKDDGSVALLNTLSKNAMLCGEPMYEEEIRFARRAAEIARIPAVRKSPYIRRLLDTYENEDIYVLVWEMADNSLRAIVAMGRAGEVDEAVLERNLRAALNTLHGVGYVHCDVAPNNVLVVDGVWKLADLNHAMPRDAAMDGVPNERYRHPNARLGGSADPDFDLYGVEQVLAELARAQSVTS
jgi:serine/threonine protein kinase